MILSSRKVLTDKNKCFKIKPNCKFNLGGKMENTKSAAEKMPKHLNIHRAINDMHGVVEHIRSIIDRINWPTPIENSKADVADPTLNEVLSFSADKIRESVDKSHQLLQEIEQALF